MKRLLHLLRRARELFPLTLGGAVLLALCAGAAWRWGLGEQDLVLLVVGGLGVALLLLSLASVLLAAAAVSWRLRGLGGARPLRLECDHPGDSGFALRRLWWAPLASLRWRWLSPAAEVQLQSEFSQLVERVTPRRRGDADHIEREVVVEGALGLVRMTLRHREARATRFEPGVGALRNIHVVRGLAGGDQLSHPEGDPSGDRIDMRRYADGDPIRFVLWKVFARSRRLVVRTPERAFAPSRQTVAYLITGPGDGPAAGAARLVVEEGALGGTWSLGADGSPHHAQDRAAAMDLIVRSAATPEGQEASGLGGFFGAQKQGEVQRVVVFTPPRPGPWLERVAQAAAANPHLRPEFIVCTDGVARSEPSRLSRWVFREPDEIKLSGPVKRQELAEVLDALARAGGRCSIIDRSTGEVFPAESLRLRRVG